MRLATFLLAVSIVSADEAAAHGWYTETSDPVTGFGCCGGNECAPIQDTDVRTLQGGYIYLPTGEFIPHRRVQHSRDRQFHRCIYRSDFINLDQGAFRGGDTRCFFAPQPSM